MTARTRSSAGPNFRQLFSPSLFPFGSALLSWPSPARSLTPRRCLSLGPPTVVVVFYALSAVTSWLFVRLARHWQPLLRAFRFQERRHGACPGLRARLICISLTLFVVSFGEGAGDAGRQVFPSMSQTTLLACRNRRRSGSIKRHSASRFLTHAPIYCWRALGRFVTQFSVDFDLKNDIVSILQMGFLSVCVPKRYLYLLLLCFFLVEHSLSEMSGLISLRANNPNASTFSENLEIYFHGNYQMVSIVSVDRKQSSFS